MTCLLLPPQPASVSAARRWAAPLLPADVRDGVVLVVSELVTNAVAADEAAGTVDDIEVELVVDPPRGHVVLAVTDASDRPLPPSPARVPGDEDGGRGLLLLDVLADDHGWAPARAAGRACGPCSGARAQRWIDGPPCRTGLGAPMLPDAHVSLRGVLPGPRVASVATEGGVTVQERGERAERREQTAQRIVEAAGVVIDRKGYAAASIPEIQDVASVSRGTVYHHFASKQELGDAVLARQGAFFAQVAARAGSAPAPMSWLQALIDISHQYTASILTDPVLRAAARLSIEPGPYQTAESYAGPLRAVTAVLESARTAGELQDHVDPAEAARTLVGCYSGVQLLAMALVERETLHQQVSAMWSLIMPGLARPDVLARLRLDPPNS